MATKKKVSKKARAKPGPKPKAKPKAAAKPKGKVKNPNMARPRHNNYPGRPPMLTPEKRDAICDIVRQGNYYDVAAAHVGVNRATFSRWLERGRREQQRLSLEPHTDPIPTEFVFLDLCKCLERAEAEAEISALKQIEAAGMGDWRSVAWRLERRQNLRWGQKKLLEHSSPEGKPVRVQKIKIGDEEIEF